MTSAVVVGAGVFGASTARELDRRGWDVTLVEQYTPGHVRSGSGGDTRLLRFSHGEVEWYTLLARRALELWRELEAEAGLRLFEPVGVAWFDIGRERLHAAQRADAATARHPVRAADAGGGGRPLPVARRSTTSAPSSSSPRQASCTRGSRRGRSRPVCRSEPGRATPADPPAADVVVWACGAWLPGPLPGARPPADLPP